MDSRYLDYLYSLGEFNIKLGLETIRSMLNRLSNPHKHPRIIHIAGTNGKGSTLATLESLLIASGFSTGSTISPHLISYNERFRINGRPVNDSSLDFAFHRVCDACGINLGSPISEDGNIRPTFYEFSIAMAFVLFESEGVDYILLETGLGGRLDATNVIRNPLASIITRIELDHQEYLGNTIEEITAEKLGILKQGSPVFVAKQEQRVSQYIQAYCRKEKYIAYSWPDDFSVVENDQETIYQVRLASPDSQNPSAFIRNFVKQTGLLGGHQAENVLTALAVYHYMIPEERKLDSKGIAQVVEELRWPGRLQYIGTRKRVLLDGAHNASGMKALLDYVFRAHSHEQLIFAVGWMKKKNLFNDLETSQYKSIRFIPMQIENNRSETKENIFRQLERNGFDRLPAMNCRELVVALSEGRLPSHDLLVIAGSLYLVGEFLDHWEKLKRCEG